VNGQALQLVGSLVAIMVLAGIAWALKLGRVSLIDDDRHAMALASEADSGFDPAEAAVSRDGRSALVGDHDGRIMVLRSHGAQFAGRVLEPGTATRIEGDSLTVTPAERRYGPVTLDLGEHAQTWARRIDALKTRQDA
tara:strand:- start:286 stop:699 length:414 start_codon:yes stop_codon:yes gene_type:complete